MSKLDWVFISIGFFLVMALSLAGLKSSLDYRNVNQREQTEAANVYAHYAYAERYCGAIGADLARLECFEQAINSEHQRQHTESDLQAQLDMSSWTYAMMWVGIVGIVVSIFGIAVVLATLRETRNMTIATREIGENQSRAYLEVEKVTISINRPDIFLGAIKNTGQTPARWFEIRSAAYAISDPKFGPRKKICFDRSLPLGNVSRWAGPGPNTPLTANVLAYRTDGTNSALSCAQNDERQVLIVQGVLRWETVFGDIMFSEFIFFTGDFFGVAILNILRDAGMGSTSNGKTPKPIKMQRPTDQLNTHVIEKRKN